MKSRGREEVTLVDPASSAGTEEPDLASGRIDIPSVNSATVWSAPGRGEFTRTRLHGWRDGYRRLMPDLQTGHTPYTERIQSRCRSAIANEQVRLSLPLSRIAELDQSLAEEARQLAARLAHPVETSVPTRTQHEDLETRRARRHAQAEKQRHDAEHEAGRKRLEAVQQQRARLAELRAHQILLTGQQQDRARHHFGQLVAAYWGSLLRAHPQREKLRSDYRIPVLALPELDPMSAHVPDGARRVHGTDSELEN